MPVDLPPQEPQGLEAQFLRQYETEPEPDLNVLTATPQQMEQGVAPLLTAILRALLPDLDEGQRELMAGQITPDDRELMLAVIDTLQRRPDLARELTFGADLFQTILDQDIELENLLGVWDDLGRALSVAEAMQNGTLGSLNARALLGAKEMIQELDPATQRTAHDQLEGTFKAAFNKQAELASERQPGKQPSDGPPDTMQGLKDQLSTAEKDTTVLRAVETILAQPAQPTTAPAAASPLPGKAGGGKKGSKARSST